MNSRLYKQYRESVVPQLFEFLKLKNIMQVPRLNKIVINMGLGAGIKDSKVFEIAFNDLQMISGQKPVPTLAKKSEAGFKIRQGMKIGAKVTLRKERMYVFFDKLVNVVIPRIKDFRGLSLNSFDGQGNYAMGLQEQVIFPEIDPDVVKHFQGMGIVFNIHCLSAEHSKKFLSLMGMPFKRK